MKSQQLNDKMILKLLRPPNTDGLINGLRQPGLPLYQPPKSMLFNLSQLIKSCGPRTDLATKTKSIGLPVDAQLAAFFARRLETLS